MFDLVWVVGVGGTCFYFDGIFWGKDTLFGEVFWDLYDVYGEWIVGDGGILWIIVSGVVVMFMLYSAGLCAVYLVNGWVVVVGMNGKILLWDGS